jgi:type II secretory pathway component PulF
MLMDLSAWFRTNGTALLVVMVVTMLGILFATQMPGLRAPLDKFMLPPRATIPSQSKSSVSF